MKTLSCGDTLGIGQRTVGSDTLGKETLNGRRYSYLDS